MATVIIARRISWHNRCHKWKIVDAAGTRRTLIVGLLSMKPREEELDEGITKEERAATDSGTSSSGAQQKRVRDQQQSAPSKTLIR